MLSSLSWLLVRVLALGIPLTLGVAALLETRAHPFRSATCGTGFSAALALLVGIGGNLPIGHASDGATGAFPRSIATELVRVDVLTGLMLILICAIAIVIVRFSRTYLDGDLGRSRYARGLLATLACVTLLVVANNLLLIALAWTGTSLAMHQLLTYYNDRPQARIAAHKKFVVSRIADACMIMALAMIWRAFGSFNLDVINSWPSSGATSQGAGATAAVLIALCVSLRSAQLPFHGWLIQVMEAPTPVSALLHAGVVNIGGFVLLRLSGLMDRAPLAQALLVVIGTTTFVLAALIMTTRISIKVSLAWSTCAQMGFMLVECGLGAWHLALLHLLAHSLYKAHAFLSSGGAVDHWRALSIRPPPMPFRPAPVLVAMGVAPALLTCVIWAARHHFRNPALGDETLLPWAILMGLSISAAAARAFTGTWRHAALTGKRLLFAIGFGLLVHTAISRIPFATPHNSESRTLCQMMVGIGILLLASVQLMVQCFPKGRLAREVQSRLFAGLFLDELFSRLIFDLWPPQFKAPRKALPSVPLVPTTERRS